MDKQEIEKKLKDGWIHSLMLIHILAITKEAAESALKKHVDALHKENRTLVARKTFLETKLVVKPHPDIPEGYSQVAEVELLTADLDSLMYVVMNYAPSSIEILAPKKLTVDIGEAQGILTSVAALIHRFAAMGIGGVVVRS